VNPTGHGREDSLVMNSTNGESELAGILDESEEFDIFFNIINRFIGHYTRKTQRRTINDTDTEYPFVAMDTRQVFAQLKFVRNYLDEKGGKPPGHGYSFLDIGCGIGNILLFAEQFGFDAHGIEKDLYPRETASSLLDTDQIYDEDIRNFERYGDFDILYYFCPLTDGQREFERHIEESLRPGGVLIANYKRDNGIRQDRRFLRLHNALPIWEKLHA